MFFDQYAGELIAFATGVAGVIIGKVTNRKREKVNLEELEIRMTEKLLSIIIEDIVEPLREELEVVRFELRTYRNAYKKMRNCLNNENCPISAELQKQEDSRKQKSSRKTKKSERQSKPVSVDNYETEADASVDNTEDDASPL